MENMNEFDGFVMPQARMLPVILLLDVSGSMSYDSKMDELNNSVREMLESFQKEQIVQADICVSIVTFGSEVKVHTELMSARDINYTDMVAGGMTYMGRALDVAYDMIEDKTKIPKNAYRPVVVLVSDGAPNDDHWEDKLTKFTTTGRSSKCDRWSLAIGADADTAMLKILKRKYATLKMLQISISSSALSPHARFSEARARIRIRWHRTCLRPIF